MVDRIIRVTSCKECPHVFKGYQMKEFTYMCGETDRGVADVFGRADVVHPDCPLEVAR